jgi:threonine synthase
LTRFTCVFCDEPRPADPRNPFCPDCREPMLVESEGQRKSTRRSSNPLSRFKDFLPVSRVQTDLCLGEGNTPLLSLPNISKRHGLPRILIKNEMLNPSGSFKDRGTVVAVHTAREMGIQRIGTVSTGNMGVSTAAYGSRAGISTFVLVKQDTPREKLISAGIHGARMIQVQGDYGELARLSYSIGKRHGIYFMNSTDPFRIEGYKVIGFEIFSQLRPHTPSAVFAPVSAGGHLIGLMKAYMELQQQGFVSQLPHFVGVQAQGCSPVAEAFAAGRPRVASSRTCRTIAQSISNPSPPGGNIVLRMIRELGGTLLAVGDEEILAAQGLLAREEGLFCLPASATVLAGLLKWRVEGGLSSREPVVLVLTGSGQKNLQAVDPAGLSLHTARLSELDELISGLTA